jgi:hypothetical protein
LILELETSKPVSFDVESTGFSGSVGFASGQMRIGRDVAGGEVLEGSFAVREGSFHAGDAAVSQLRAGIAIRSAKEVELTSFFATIDDGGTVTAAPFVFDPHVPAIRTRLSIANFGLAQWLPRLTGDRATGEGRVSGDADISIDLAGGSVELSQLNGTLAADPRDGFIHVTDADSLGALLDTQDPRFATDPVMRPVRDKIVAAFRDFAFNQLTVDLSRLENHTVARAYISGHGRHGADPQGLNITLDLHVHDALVTLATRMAGLSKAQSAAADALERFFDNRERQP